DWSGGSWHLAVCSRVAGARACFFLLSYRPARDLHSFPTRRSSDLFESSRPRGPRDVQGCVVIEAECGSIQVEGIISDGTGILPQDRKSTRLNSSHDQISYAVFCLKKKNVARGRVALACAADRRARG